MIFPSYTPAQLTTELEITVPTLTTTSASKLLAMQLQALHSSPAPIAVQDFSQQPPGTCHVSLQGGSGPPKEEVLSREVIPGVSPVAGEDPFDVRSA